MIFAGFRISRMKWAALPKPFGRRFGRQMRAQLYPSGELGFAMATPHELRTDRLRLRRWIPTDLAPFAALNADPRVTEYLPGPLSQAESDAFVARIEAHFDEHDFVFGPWKSAMQRHSQASSVSWYRVSHPTSLPVGDWMASRHGVRGPRVRYGGSSSRACVRLRRTQAYGSRIVHGTGKCTLASRDGKDRDGPQGVGRF